MRPRGIGAVKIVRAAAKSPAPAAPAAGITCKIRPKYLQTRRNNAMIKPSIGKSVPAAPRHFRLRPGRNGTKTKDMRRKKKKRAAGRPLACRAIGEEKDDIQKQMVAAGAGGAFDRPVLRVQRAGIQPAPGDRSGARAALRAAARRALRRRRPRDCRADGSRTGPRGAGRAGNRLCPGRRRFYQQRSCGGGGGCRRRTYGRAARHGHRNAGQRGAGRAL